MNIDAVVIHADWLRIIARMRVIAAEHPETSNEERRIAAEGDQLASRVS